MAQFRDKAGVVHLPDSYRGDDITMKCGKLMLFNTPEQWRDAKLRSMEGYETLEDPTCIGCVTGRKCAPV